LTRFGITPDIFLTPFEKYLTIPKKFFIFFKHLCPIFRGKFEILTLFLTYVDPDEGGYGSNLIARAAGKCPVSPYTL